MFGYVGVVWRALLCPELLTMCSESKSNVHDLFDKPRSAVSCPCHPVRESGRRMSWSISQSMGMEVWGVEDVFMLQHDSRTVSRGRGAAVAASTTPRLSAGRHRAPTYLQSRAHILYSSTEANAVAAAADEDNDKPYRHVLASEHGRLRDGSSFPVPAQPVFSQYPNRPDPQVNRTRFYPSTHTP
jgi:hypothetical protein